MLKFGKTNESMYTKGKAPWKTGVDISAFSITGYMLQLLHSTMQANSSHRLRKWIAMTGRKQNCIHKTRQSAQYD